MHEYQLAKHRDLLSKACHRFDIPHNIINIEKSIPTFVQNSSTKLKKIAIWEIEGVIRTTNSIMVYLVSLRKFKGANFGEHCSWKLSRGKIFLHGDGWTLHPYLSDVEPNFTR